MSTAHFQKLPQSSKFMIGNVPDDTHDVITVEAQFNPKELQIEAPIKWKEHEVIGAQSVATKPMEFTGMGAETMKVELVFDAFEDDSNAVVDAIANLKKMASVHRDNIHRGKFERPSFCVATWGTQAPFRCVIESINVKYTMFAFDGTPVRATVVLGLKSGCRTIDTNGETTYEKTSRERMEARAERQRERALAGEAQAMLDAAERAARYEAAAADRRLAEREARVYEERQQIEAARAERQREIRAREQRIARERRVAEEERELATERERDRAAREQRKKDFDLE